MFSKSFLAAALAVVGVTAQNATSSGNSTASSNSTSTANMNLTALIASNPQLSQLGAILTQYPTIATSLSNMTNITFLAPNNQAISVLRRGGVSRELQDQALVTALVDYHVLQGKYLASDITAVPQFVPSALNSSTYTNVTGGQVVECQLKQNTTVTFTSGLKLESNVTQANLNFTNGVVHVINEVLTVPYNVSTTAIAANLTSFVGAIDTLNLSSTLNGASDITIFAPSNDAFQAVGNVLANASTNTLTSILEYHVINGTVAYSTLLGNGSVATLGGSNLTITVTDGAAFVNGARIINSDLLVSGGVMHVIDSVLNPNGTNAQDRANATATSATAAFSSASEGTVVPLTSGVATPTTTNVALITTVTDVVSGFPQQTGGAVNTQGGTSSGMAPAATGMIGAVALFGGAALVANL